MQVSKPHRHRSPSDPFNDAHSPSYSSYAAPTLTRNAPPQQATNNAHRAPPPPPKVPPKSSSSTRKPNHSSAMDRNGITEAVRETVQLRSTDQGPRTRMGRSNTEMAPHPSSRPSTAPSRRSHSQDSSMNAPAGMERTRSDGRTRTGSTAAKKGSSHADVIDRLDFSGVGPMFHHDGPFDACAPSRNRHRTRAPMMAWSAVTDADTRALANAQEIPRAFESPYPSRDVYVPYEAPKKNYDAIAEAWGIHEPEPFEDFSAGGGTLRSGADSHNNSRNGTARRADRDRSQRERPHDDNDVRPSARRQQTKRGPLPPPQPIFVPETEVELAQQSAEPSSPNDAPKRNKSIIRRIRKMRDSPNVPVAADDEALNRDPSPTSSAENSATTHSHSTSNGARPTHRPQNSFLGRFGRGANVARREDGIPDDTGYVYVEDPVPLNKEKSLPEPPAAKGGYSPPGENMPGYFDNAGGGAAVSPGGNGLGRKASLLKKVKGVVKGAKA
ncbi:hypothetical protein WOLCODRAFT_135278 [Wolfiporia cocos MD-104 SS10]|uniref:Pal1-domain-containing protein n=1 Tax=Wolfiporia cocos (strain MD-104) TaxID=742152 RepID=A0A2H3JAM2_WOLCO|nr:hypothetical protein WOLCODRAFT_135278 [Wolfiporia cocos MD-104 SS10]